MDYADRLRGARDGLVRALDVAEVRPPAWITEDEAPLTARDPFVVAIRQAEHLERQVTVEAGGGGGQGFAYQVMLLRQQVDGEWVPSVGPRMFSYPGHAVWFATMLLNSYG